MHLGVLLANRLKDQAHGVIVALSSVAGERVRRSNFVYGSTKAGFDGFYLGLGEALRGTGVRVLVVRPGFVKSKMTDGHGRGPAGRDAAGGRRRDRRRGGRQARADLGAGADALRHVGPAARAPPAVPQAAPLSLAGRSPSASRVALAYASAFGLVASYVATRPAAVRDAWFAYLSTNLANLADHPVRALVGSAFVTDDGTVLAWVVLAVVGLSAAGARARETSGSPVCWPPATCSARW